MVNECRIEGRGDVAEVPCFFQLGRVELELGRLKHADIFSHLLMGWFFL